MIMINISLLQNFPATLKQVNLARKSNIANFAKEADFDKKIKDVT